MLLILFSSYLIGLLSFCLSWWCLLSYLPILFFAHRIGKKKLIITSSFMLLMGILTPFLLSLRKIDGNVSLTGIVTKSGTNYYLLLTWKGKVYVPNKNNGINLFSIVSLNGQASELSFSHYEGSFSFKDYLKNLGVVSQVSTKTQKVIFDSYIDLNAYKDWCTSYLNGTEKILCRSILFFSVPSEWSGFQELNEMGLLTMLFSCGIHVSWILRKIYEFLSIKIGTVRSRTITFILSFSFMFIGGFNFTGIRIFSRQTISLILDFKKVRLDEIYKSSISFFIMLLFFPRYCLEEAFWYPFAFNICGRLSRPILCKMKGLKKVLVRQLCQSFVIVPFALYLNGTYGLLSLFIMPFLTVMSNGLFLITMPLYICPIYGKAIYWLYQFIISIFYFSSKNDYLIFSSDFPFYLLIVWFCIGFLLSLFISLNFKKASRICSASLLCLFLMPSLISYIPKYEVHFIDVGQGSSTLIRYGTNNILIDTGGSIYNDLASDCLIPYFRRIGVHRLEGVLLTHGDYDHDGALDSLLKSFPIDFYLYGKQSKESFLIGDMQFKNFNFDATYEDENSSSGVFSFEIKSTNFLIMGDVPKNIELEILKKYPNLSVDVLLAGHHGSKTSSDFNFIKSVSPKLAVISVGENNKYGHPDKETLDTFSSLGVEVFRTDLSGTLVYRC